MTGNNTATLGLNPSPLARTFARFNSAARLVNVSTDRNRELLAKRIADHLLRTSSDAINRVSSRAALFNNTVDTFLRRGGVELQVAATDTNKPSLAEAAKQALANAGGAGSRHEAMVGMISVHLREVIHLAKVAIAGASASSLKPGGLAPEVAREHIQDVVAHVQALRATAVTFLAGVGDSGGHSIAAAARDGYGEVVERATNALQDMEPPASAPRPAAHSGMRF